MVCDSAIAVPAMLQYLDLGLRMRELTLQPTTWQFSFPAFAGKMSASLLSNTSADGRKSTAGTDWVGRSKIAVNGGFPEVCLAFCNPEGLLLA